MGCFFRVFFIAIFFVSLIFIIPTPGLSQTTTPTSEPSQKISFNTSTQFIWGDDILGESQFISAQYLRLSTDPENKKFFLSGYGRIWKDFGSGAIRDDDFLGRLYYLYMDYVPLENLSFRLGRQYVNFTAGSSIMDGLSVDIHKIGPIGITVSGGMDNRFSLDSEHSRLGNYFFGFDIHLQNVKSLQLGVSHVRKYDEWDSAREEFGLNFKYYYKFLSPYADIRYDRLSETFDEATFGIDIFPMYDLIIKGEFYHSYPTFDSTSIYSVFAVDKYQEYLISAEYSFFVVPVTMIVSYARQTYEDSEDADRYRVRARYVPLDNLVINSAVDYRQGFGGNIWGFEIDSYYRVKNTLTFSAGMQYDSYRRPDFSADNYDYAQQYWLGNEWIIKKNLILSARVEDNVNENFEHRPSGRLVLNWKM